MPRKSEWLGRDEAAPPDLCEKKVTADYGRESCLMFANVVEKVDSRCAVLGGNSRLLTFLAEEGLSNLVDQNVCYY